MILEAYIVEEKGLRELKQDS